MRLLTESGTTNLIIDHSVTNNELLNVSNIISPFISGLTDWNIGVIFALVEIRLEINLQETLAIGNIPAINYEDSSAARLEKSVASKNISQKMGLEFLINNKQLGVISLKNYGIVYNLSVLGHFSKNTKMLNRSSILSCKLFDLGQGAVLLFPDYINISIDYIFEINGVQLNDVLKINIDKLPIESQAGVLLKF